MPILLTPFFPLISLQMDIQNCKIFSIMLSFPNVLTWAGGRREKGVYMCLLSCEHLGMNGEYLTGT